MSAILQVGSRDDGLHWEVLIPGDGVLVREVGEHLDGVVEPHVEVGDRVVVGPFRYALYHVICRRRLSVTKSGYQDCGKKGRSCRGHSQSRYHSIRRGSGKI